MNPIERFWLNCLMKASIDPDDKSGPRFIPCAWIHHLFLEEAKSLGLQRRPTETELGIALNKLIPGLKRSRKTLSGGKRFYAYDLPDLQTCRLTSTGSPTVSINGQRLKRSLPALP
jgi:hypothetical protein